AHGRLLRPGRLEQARRDRRAPGLPAEPRHRGPHRLRRQHRRRADAHRRRLHGATTPQGEGAVMDQVTTGAVPDDEELTRFGYRQEFARSLRHFESFAVAFSFISITTGIFTTYLFALTTGGTRSIWTWPIVIAGQALVALVYGALSIRV